VKANVRIVAATHRGPARLHRAGLFREDLFYRLNVVPIRLPPLRERTEDIPLLARHFLGPRQGRRPARQDADAGGDGAA
jgi:two-component system nitrogen regulation response regulator GlnG